MLEAVDKVVPVDDLTLDLETSIPQPALLKCFIPALVPVLPAHIYGDGTPIDTHPANLRAVGSGPFRLASLEEGKNIVLERYKGFFLPGKPRLDRITFRVYWDQNEIPLAIMQGEADLYAFSSLSDEERIFRSNPAIEVTRDEFSLLHPFALLTFNVRNPIFRSPEVRKALAMSIDNKALAQAVPGGVQPMYGPIPPGSEWHSPVSTPYDPDEANRILDRAGYPRNENGIRFTVEIDYEPSAQFSLSILKYLQSQFIRTIGVYFRIRTAEGPGFMGEPRHKRRVRRDDGRAVRLARPHYRHRAHLRDQHGGDPVVQHEPLQQPRSGCPLPRRLRRKGPGRAQGAVRRASGAPFPRARRPLALHHPLRHDPQPQRPARRGSAFRRPFTVGRSLLETPMSIMDKSIASRIALLLGLFCLVLCAFLISLLQLLKMLSEEADETVNVALPNMAIASYISKESEWAKGILHDSILCRDRFVHLGVVQEIEARRFPENVLESLEALAVEPGVKEKIKNNLDELNGILAGTNRPSPNVSTICEIRNGS